RLVRSAKFWDTVTCRQRRFTPRSTSTRYDHWQCHGREKFNEHTPTGRSGLYRDAPRAGLQAARGRKGIDRLRRLPGAKSRAIYHDGTGACLGSATVACAAFTLGETIGLRPGIRTPPRSR